MLSGLFFKLYTFITSKNYNNQYYYDTNYYALQWSIQDISYLMSDTDEDYFRLPF